MEQYTVWRDGTPTQEPVRLYDTVEVKSYGGGVTQQDIGRTGLVVKINRTKVVVADGDWHISAWPSQLNLRGRQEDRCCPVCKADRGKKCFSMHGGRKFEHVLMHLAR